MRQASLPTRSLQASAFLLAGGFGLPAHAQSTLNGRLDRTVLAEADLHGADLNQASIRGARLANADLQDADLRQADLRDADLSGARIDASTQWRNARMRGCSGCPLQRR